MSDGLQNERLLLLRRSFQVVPIAEDDVYLYRAQGPSYRIKIPGAAVLPFISLLMRGVTEDELSSLVRSDERIPTDTILALTSELAAVGVLQRIVNSEGIAAKDSDRFERQLSYLAEYETGEVSRYDYHRNLRSARILMLGLGSLGSWTLQHLVACGVGSIVGVDRDSIEPSNLARQCFYAEADVGIAKADAAVRAVKALSSLTDFTGIRHDIGSSDDIVALLSDGRFDLTILTADMPVWKMSFWASEAAMRTGVPLLRGNSLGIGPLMLPGSTACPACAWPRLLESIPNAEQVIAMQRSIEGMPASALSTEIGMAGAFLAEEALSFLSGARPVRTYNTQIRVDLDGPSVTLQPFPRRPDCPVCSKAEAGHS